MKKPKILDIEFQERINKTQKQMIHEGLDLLLCFGNEIEPQFVRYYSDYWPSFESAGVLIPQNGQPLLLIGPESKTFATYMSRIPDIRQLLVFRESSEPEYPDMKLDTFSSVLAEITQNTPIKSIGLAGYSLMPHVIFDNLINSLKSFGSPEIRHADMLVNRLRAIKSSDEIACMREAYRISTLAMINVLDNLKAGMTENQVKGLALSKIFEEGGEGEAYAFWILTGDDSNQAISRCRGKILQPGDLVQIQVAARYEGYASSIGRPVVLGKPTSEQQSMIEGALAAQHAILSNAKAGINANEVAKIHRKVLEKHGQEQHILYGPCHGTGLMEGEYPWIESNSDFILDSGMTFCTCIYLGDDEKRMGIRVEDGFLITDDGTESFSDYRREVIVIPTSV